MSQLTVANNDTPATGWCPNCGETRLRADDKCSRCGAGAVAAHTQEAEDRRLFRVDGDQVAHVNGTETVVLPANRRITRWLSETSTLLAGLKAERTEAETLVRHTENKIADLDRAIGALHSTLQRIQVDEAVSAAAAAASGRPHRGRTPHEERPWASTRDGQTYTACRDCGRSDRPHKTHGRCDTCHHRADAASRKGS